MPLEGDWKRGAALFRPSGPLLGCIVTVQFAFLKNMSSTGVWCFKGASLLAPGRAWMEGDLSTRPCTLVVVHKVRLRLVLPEGYLMESIKMPPVQVPR